MTKSLSINHLDSVTELFAYSERLGFGELHTKQDPDTGLFAIVAIHNTNLGPALGGCRCIPYASITAAIVDALRLAQGMSYKAALANVPQGGAKSVLIRPATIKDEQAFFSSFGKFINALNGRYITAVDSGTTLKEMDIIATQTSYIASSSAFEGSNGDPSPYTAIGVRRGIEAAVNHLLKRDTLDGLHIAIQGVGTVGYLLAKALSERGATLTVADVNQVATERCRNEFSATIVPTEEIHKTPCDIFAPCALGAILNDATIPQLKCKIVAGAANNQLAEARHCQQLGDANILYVPDYVLNAGGLIHASGLYNKVPEHETRQRVTEIYDTVATILQRAGESQATTCEIADHIAEERLEIRQ